jgi:hypothetical protein
MEMAVKSVTLTPPTILQSGTNTRRRQLQRHRWPLLLLKLAIHQQRYVAPAWRSSSPMTRDEAGDKPSAAAEALINHAKQQPGDRATAC